MKDHKQTITFLTFPEDATDLQIADAKISIDHTLGYLPFYFWKNIKEITLTSRKRVRFRVLSHTLEDGNHLHLEISVIWVNPSVKERKDSLNGKN